VKDPEVASTEIIFRLVILFCSRTSARAYVAKSSLLHLEALEAQVLESLFVTSFVLQFDLADRQSSVIPLPKRSSESICDIDLTRSEETQDPGDLRVVSSRGAEAASNKANAQIH
jgi:hypothetical protein